MYFSFTIHATTTTKTTTLQLAPLMPKVDAILVLGSDGDRLAGKYYGDFLKVADDGHSREETRHNFEKEVQQKIGGIVA